jgi:2-keto-4-pentenoate hydratase
VSSANPGRALASPAATADRINAAQDRLWTATVDHTPCAPVRDLLVDDELDAYAVQRAIIERRVAGGARVVGRKIGLTAPAVQRQLGVDRPDFGVLLDDMVVADRGIVSVRRLLQPKIEAEVAFVLGADIDDAYVTAESVRAAVDYAVAALEIVDSRIAGWDITYADTVADNASSGLFVLGNQRRTLAEFEPADVRMSMTLGPAEVSTGAGRDCLGDPLNALAWLARTAAEFGDPLRAGQIILSGALGPMVAVGAGDEVTARIVGLGEVSVRFEGGT